MIYKMFSIYDSKAEAYLQPFFMVTKGQAIRALTDILSDPAHQFSKYSADFTLFELGEYNDSNATFSILPSPLSMGVILEFVKV